MQAVLKDAEERMKKVLATLDKEFSRLRTGRASSSLLDGLRVDYYSTMTQLDQLASVATPDSRSITIQPWDRKAFSEIEKAIMKSDLGLTPVNDGKVIRLNIPPLTEERRKDLVKMGKKHAEEAKVAVRNIRRDANELLKKKKNDKSINEDDQHKGQEDVQKLTDSYIAKTDEAFSKKEKEIMEI